LTKEEKETLLRYRLERAYESIKAAKIMHDHGFYIPSMNRIYYSMFYAVQALVVLNEKSYAKHGQVKGYFNREFITSGIFPKEFGRLFNTVFEYRQKFDYVDLAVPEKEMVEHYILEAKKFIDTIVRYIKELASINFWEKET